MALSTRSALIRARKVEASYAKRLLQLGRQIGEWVADIDPANPAETAEFASRLNRYSEILRPWATSVATTMLAEISGLDKQQWRARSAEMGRLVRAQIEGTPVGALTQSLLAEQIGLITSIPVEAAERVRALSLEGLINATRAKEIAAEIMRSGEVAKSSAMTIARTEVSRAHTSYTQARAQHAGSTGYIWRTSHDGDVRPSHKTMAGHFVPWGSPPTLDKMTGHAGCLPNCRCYPEPVFTNGVMDQRMSPRRTAFDFSFS